ncbi:MAG TPA: phage portal protein [Polyangiaceae bacterium]|nr:phage portal protein [Polyangiaceae bacterium]
MIGKLWKAVFGRKGSKRLAVSSLPGYRGVVYDGEKFSGGIGAIDVLFKDLWALRARSAEVFERNPFARGIIRRFVTNVVNTGLHLEATPEERLLGFEEDELGDWAEDVETRFQIWGKNAYQCDFDERRTFGQLQAELYREALVAGDVLVVRRQDPRTGNPRIQLISGARVQTPWLQKLPEGTRIEHGVEVDARGRHVAFWVTQDNGSFKRLPAYGEKSGRKIAWLVYGTDRRLDEVRGTPLLGLVLQSLKELDRYRDATLRKAVINSMLAMYIKKGEERFGSLPMTGGATKVGTEETIDDKGKPRRYRSAEMIPGLVIDELQYGEEPVPFQVQNTVENYGDFEEAIVCAMAWALEVPPEILRLTFSSNYSASQAAIGEFKLFLNPTRTRFGEEFCAPIYEEWLLSQVFMNRVPAEGLLKAFRSLDQDDIYGAWIANDWSGHVKPTIDPVKTTRAYTEQAENGFIDRDRASREINGTNFDKNVKYLKRQNIKLAEAMRPLLEVQALLKASGQPLPPDQPERGAEDDDKGSAERAA